MKLVLHFPCKLIGVNGTAEAEGFETRTFDIDDVVTFLYAWNPTEKRTGYNLVLKTPTWSPDFTDEEDARRDEFVDKLYKELAARTGWKQSVDWDGRMCLFTLGEWIGKDFGVVVANELWVSHELTDEKLEDEFRAIPK
jgi:hypothetical protein